MSSDKAVIESLNKTIDSLTRTNESLTNEIALLREQVDYLTRKLFGRSSERNQIKVSDGQMSLFDDEDFFGEEPEDLPR